MGGFEKGHRRKGGNAVKNWQERARRMVDAQLRGRGILDERVLAAMERVPRTAFVPAELEGLADFDGPLVITSYSIHYTKLYETSIQIAVERKNSERKFLR